mgnify:FL=1
MYYEYLHQDGLMTEWLTCEIVDPEWKDDKLHIKYKLGHDEFDTWVPTHRVRLCFTNMELSQ